MTRPLRWKVLDGTRILGLGTVHAADEREGLKKLLAGEVDLGFKARPESSYTVRIGDCSVSTYGDEFARCGEAVGAGVKDPPPSHGGYAYPGLRRRGTRMVVDCTACGHGPKTCKCAGGKLVRAMAKYLLGQLTADGLVGYKGLSTITVYGGGPWEGTYAVGPEWDAVVESIREWAA